LNQQTAREHHWSEAIAVGSLGIVENVKSELGSKGLHRAVEHIDGAYALRATSEAYNDDFGSETEPRTLENTVFGPKLAKLQRHSEVRPGQLGQRVNDCRKLA
jgi:hypothetical protein